MLPRGFRHIACGKIHHLAFVAIVIGASPCGAASLLPLRTEMAQTLAARHVEVTLGATFLDDPRFPLFTGEGALSAQQVITAPEFALRAAAASRVEVQASFEMIALDETAASGEKRQEFGNGDAQLFTKVRVIRESELRPAFGLRFGTKLPNADRHDRLGTDQIDFHFEALGSKVLGPVELHANLGIALLDNPGPMLGAPARTSSGQDDLFTYSVAAISLPFRAGRMNLRVGAEVAGAAGSRFGNDRNVLRAGLQVRHGEVALYGGGSIGLDTASEDFGASVGAIYTFDLERLFGRAE